MYIRVGEGGEGRRRLGTDVIRLFSDRLPLTITTKIFPVIRVNYFRIKRQGNGKCFEKGTNICVNALLFN